MGSWQSLVVAWILTVPAVGSAQRAVLGQIRDTDGRPGVGIGVRVGLGPRVVTDTMGHFRIERVPNGPARLLVLCPSASFWHATRLAVLDIPGSAGDTVLSTQIVATQNCREPAVDSIEADFIGHYSTGFEESRFVPCHGTVERTWGRSLEPTGHAWVEFDSLLRRQRLPGLPKPFDEARLFVTWEGRMTGPGDFGHLGMAGYRLVVSRVRTTRTARAGDCRRASH